ncbi:adhesion G protein-coupled receptor E5-like [Mercenaria mercenaria]|uniref:adhesion G protein-coupled receptor E5-like n=1 Tax=Mercenaria mercenaria TaxID=6596 RepID=UPI00234FA0FC|nr:adhesion G protein-coupled receptor E5-like [Mercenaria mercenaria]
MCNGVLPRSLTCPLGSRIHVAHTFAFSGLLKLDKVDAVLDIRSSNRDIDKCLEDQLYDKILDSCKNMVCSAITVLKSGTCVDLFTNLEKITYTAFLRLKPVNPLSVKDAHIVADHVIAHMEEFLDGSELCGMQIIYKPNVSLSETDLSFVENSNLLYFDARVWFYISKRHDPNQILAKLMHLHDSNQTFRMNNRNDPVIFKFQVKDDHPEKFDAVSFLSQSNDKNNDSETSLDGYDFVLLPNLIANNYEGTCAFRKQDYNIIEITTCPKIEVHASDVPWKEGENGITFQVGNYVLKSNEYYFIDEDHIMVCADKYKHYLTQIPQEERDTSLSVESIISIACSAVSILALSFTFFVYCFFSKLRGTIPGKNNMSLVFTLLLAQTLYLTGSFSDFKRNSTECLLFGILIHLAWLVALFWMNICTFHMFRVLARTKVMSQSSGTKRLVIYHVYAQSMAAISVSINIGVSYFMSGDFGYGTETCYISSQQMIIYTFGIPAAFVVLSNLFMFTFVIIKIKRSPSVQKNVQNERNDIIVFAKLSTITGATWVFGFLYMWTSSAALSYMFIVLNASQGLFIMLAFVINKRVYDLFRCQVLGLTVTSSESRRPTSKTSIKMSDKS